MALVTMSTMHGMSSPQARKKFLGEPPPSLGIMVQDLQVGQKKLMS